MPSPMRLPRVGDEMEIFWAVVPRDFNIEFEIAVTHLLDNRRHYHPDLESGIDFAQAKSALLQLIGNHHFRMQSMSSEDGYEDDDFLTEELPFDDDTPFDEPF